MATSTEKKYSKLKGEQTYQAGAKNKQLIYPIDLANNKDNPGHVVVFEINQISDHSTGKYENGLTQSTTNIRVDNASSREVAMQTSSGQGTTIRNSDMMTSGRYKKTDMSIVLPMPDQLMSSNYMNWQTTELGAIGRAGDFVSSVKELNGGEAWSQVKAGSVDTISKTIQGLGIANTRDLAQISTGRVANSYQEVLFKSVNNRFFSFSFTFTPRNKKEADVVRAIVHRFRWAALPEYAFKQEKNTSYFKAPHTFDINYIDLNNGNSHNKWLTKISTCALTNITVNGTPNGEYAVLEDGAFAACVLELMFTELVVLNKSMLEDIDNSF